MSILASAEPLDPRAILFFTSLAACALLLAWWMGIFEPGSMAGPPRLAGGQPLAGLVLVFIVAGMVWFGTQSAYLAPRRATLEDPARKGRIDLSRLTPDDNAFLATVPASFALLVLLIGDALLPGRVPAQLGYAPRRLPRGIVAGAAACAIVLPLVMFSMLALQILYDLLHYQHPNEHELLRALKSVGPRPAAAIIFGATIITPVFEECFFRGHLQSLLRRAIRSPWGAVLITSALFALVHPLWTAPAIFLLAIGLGYLYERTGNLWGSITMHACFNILNVSLFLLKQP